MHTLRSVMRLVVPVAIFLTLWSVLPGLPSAFAQTPVISSLSPTSGSVETLVTITGSGFGTQGADKHQSGDAVQRGGVGVKFVL